MAFNGIADGRERRSAQALLNTYHRQVDKWTRESDEINNQEHLELWDYIGYTQTELDEFKTLAEFKHSLEARRWQLDDSVDAQRQRMQRRNADQRKSARKTRAKAEKEGKTVEKPKGRPKSNLLTYGQYVHFAVAYNHGLGAGFSGYGPGGAEPSPIWSPTKISEWSLYWEG